VSGLQIKERLAAVLAADAAGYSRLMAADGRATLAALDSARAIFRTQIEANQGRVIDMAGDSVLAVFETANGAVSAAIAAQVEINTASSEIPEDRRMRFRIGVHLGDLIEKADGTVYGDGVNIASRLQAMAEVGGITVSDAVRGAVRGKVTADFGDQGEYRIKNIAYPVRAFAVRVEGAIAKPPSSGDSASLANQPPSAVSPSIIPVSSRSARAAYLKLAAAGFVGIAVILIAGDWYLRSARVGEGTPSVAHDTSAAKRSLLSVMVLPFANGTGDSQQDYIADGLTANVTSDLSRIRDAFVISTATAYTYKDKRVSLQQLGQDLGVRFVLQGSVQRSGNTLRINAQLGDTASNAQLWSETFEGNPSDLFALEDQVTTRIGNSIGREMVIAAAREAETRKSSPQVADLMLRARALDLKPRSLQNFRQTESWYREVLALEPGDASALIGLGRSIVLQLTNFDSEVGEAGKRRWAEGCDLAQKAKTLDPDNPQIYAVLSVCYEANDDFAGSLRAAETRVSLDRKNPDANYDLARTYLNAAQPKPAIELLNLAMSLDPRHTDELDLSLMGYAYFMLGDNDKAIEWYQRALERNPVPRFYSFLAMAYALKGDEAKAHAAAAEYHRLDPNGSLSKTEKVSLSSYPAATREWFEKTYYPAWLKAGLPE
jgi:TolB-like protein/class 3 adenylate cyclase/Flp pilus assembly protein TadD